MSNKLPTWPGTAIKVFGACLFLTLLILLLWSIFGPSPNLSSEEERRVNDLFNKVNVGMDAGQDT